MRTLFIGPCLLPTGPHAFLRGFQRPILRAAGIDIRRAGGLPAPAVRASAGRRVGGAGSRSTGTTNPSEGRFTRPLIAARAAADGRRTARRSRRGTGGNPPAAHPARRWRFGMLGRSSRPARGQSRDGGDHHCPREARRPPRETGSHLRPPGPPECPRAVAGDVYPGPRPRPGFFRVGGLADARDRDRRPPVGRRGQGQDHRLPRRARRRRRPLPGRRQRGPHRRRGRRDAQAPAVPVGRALPAHHVGHRQRRRRQPGHAHRRARHAGGEGHRRLAGSGSAAART